MRSLALFILSAAAACAASSPFDGRWDITIAGDSAHAWWLGLEGVGTPAAKGTFVSDYWGDLNKIDEISVEGDRLTYGFRHKAGGRGIHDIYSARIETAVNKRFHSLEKGVHVGMANFRRLPPLA